MDAAGNGLGPNTLLPMRPWQAEEFERHKETPKWAVFADPRTGKTDLGARILRHWAQRGATRLLVSAPLGVCPFWVNTLKAAGLTVYPAYSKTTPEIERDLKLIPLFPARSVVVINIDKLWPLRFELADWAQGYICDEVHETASASAHRARAARRIAWKAKAVRVLTGTPIPNHHGDFWSPLTMIGGYDGCHGDFMREFCLVPETRVLTADLRWEPIGSLSVGDKLVGFDEEPQRKGAHRSARRCDVQKLSRVQQPCVKVVTDRGTVICSEDHRWLTRQGRALKWASAAKLVPGRSQIVRLASGTWETDETNESGYLAGVFDGEGWISRHVVGFGQNDGIVLNRTKALLQEKGFDYRFSTDRRCRTLTLKTAADSLRFLGTVRPSRLLANAGKVYEGARLTAPKGRAAFAKVLRVESVGVREVVSIQTSTRTLLAEGLFSHNCYRDPMLPSRVLGHVNIDEFHKLFRKHATIVPRESVFGPDSWQYIRREIELPPQAAAMYAKLKKEWALDEGGVKVMADHTLARMTRLQQLTSGFLPGEDGTDVEIHSAKIDACVADLGEVFACGKKAVIFHRFRWEGDRMIERLRSKVPLYVINGDYDGDAREAQRVGFENEKDAAGIVVQIQSGSTGISLQSADYAMYLSRTFSFVRDQQSRDRIYKPGDVRTVTYYEVDNSIDTFIAKALKAKLNVHEAARNAQWDDIIGEAA